MANASIIYLGFGLLANKAFVQTLFGRELKPTEIPMELEGVELRVLGHKDLPQVIRDDTSPGFRIYGLTHGNPDCKVGILRLEISPEEYATIRALNYENALYTSEPHGFPDGSHATVDYLSGNHENLGVRTNGLSYNPFLNGRTTAYRIARLLRDQYLRPVREGGKSSTKER